VEVTNLRPTVPWMLNEKNEVPSDGTDGIAFDALTDAQNLKPNSGYAIL
jgi:hypothetical protein